MASGAQRRKQMKLEALATRLENNEVTALENKLVARLEFALAISAKRFQKTHPDCQTMLWSATSEERARAVKLLLHGERTIRIMESRAHKGLLGMHAEVDGVLVSMDHRKGGLKQRMPNQSNSPIIAHAAALAVSEASDAAAFLTARVYGTG